MDTFIKTIVPLQLTHKNWGLVYANNQFLCQQQQVIFDLATICKQLKTSDYQLISLGLWKSRPLYLVILKKQITVLGNTQWLSLRPIMLQTDLDTFKLLGYAAQLATWMIDYKYCGRCSKKMQANSQQHVMQCKHCGYQIYPRINPSMIVLITRGDEILLARSPRFTVNMYSTLAGFVEPSESVEDCIHREVQEEVGITVKNLHYIASQNWPYPNALMLGFHAEYNRGEITPQPEEIEDARWFSVHDLPELPPKQAISRYLIDLYVAKRLATSEPVFPH